MNADSVHSGRLTAAEGHIALTACSVALGTLVVVSCYQTGLIGHLPDPPYRIFASDRITSSKAAHPLGIPDGLLGLASFGVTLGLLVLSRKSATSNRLLGGKLALDAAAAGFNATRQIVSFGKICSWCTGTALATGVMALAGRRTIVASTMEALGVARTLIT
jgi:uncharacterized membrane protein